VAPAAYINTDSDEDDWQAWDISKDTWDLVPSGGMKKIRLKFNVSQHGQSTRFHGIVYQVTATGYL
jgi:hypothetical protein